MRQSRTPTGTREKNGVFLKEPFALRPKGAYNLVEKNKNFLCHIPPPPPQKRWAAMAVPST